MKGKLAFLLGAAVGYVLGTRAGRERYEQIKRGAQRVWETEPVQQGVKLVRDAVDDRADDLKAFAVRVGNDVFSNLAKNRQQGGATAEQSSGATSGDPEPAPKPAAKAGAAQPRKPATKRGKPAGAKRAESDKGKAGS